MNGVDRYEEGRLASEARHGAAFSRHSRFLAQQGWVNGLGWAGVVQMARILSGLGQPARYSYEWREPEWPIYRRAILAKYAGGGG